MTYKQLKFIGIDGLEFINIQKINDDGSLLTFIADEANTNYQAYLAWLEEGNTPEPAEE